MGRGMIPVPSVPIRIGFLLLVLVVIIHDLVVSVVILTALGIAALLAAHVGTGLSAALGTLGVGLLIELLADGVEVLGQGVGSGLDGGGVGALQGLLQLESCRNSAQDYQSRRNEPEKRDSMAKTDGCRTSFRRY